MDGMIEIPSPPILNTQHAREMLRKRYPSPEWACMLEVAPSTGGGTRYADAVAVNLWSSRGHAVHGFEIKVSRGDWLRELKKPEKAETSVYRYCDYWWIAAPKGVVKDGELPPTWGLLELRAAGYVQIAAAPKLDAQTIGRAFFASLMRRGHEQIEMLAEAKIRDVRRETVERQREEIQEQVEQSTRHHRELLARLEEVKAETGLDFGGRWGGSISVETIRLAQRLACLEGWSGKGALSRLTQLAKELDQAAAAVRKAAADTGLEGEPTPQEEQTCKS